MSKRAGRIVGHIDRIDKAGVTGWAAGGSNTLPQVTLSLSGVPLDIVVERLERSDVAAIHGPHALQSGFFISLRALVPDDATQLPEFLAKIEVRADGRLLKPSAGAVLPGAVTKRGIGRHLKAVRQALLPWRTSAMSVADRRKYILEPRRLARVHGRDLKIVSDKTRKIRSNDILLFATARNEMLRIPYFLDYYRKLGVHHFLFVDNDSSDGLSEHLKGQADCSVWSTTASYKASNFGVHWMNHILHRYGAEHWCLTVDPDEFLVFPYCEDRNLHELTEFLETIQQNHLFCVLLDMYSDRPVSRTVYTRGQNPLEVAPYFDEVGYVQRVDALLGETFIQGGPRRRIFFRDHPEKAPAINKTPLVRWKRDYNYLMSTHMLSSRHINQAHKPGHLSITGCLLHFKFFSVMADKAAEEIERKEHYDNSIEYRNYHTVISNSRDMLFFEKSRKYRHSRELVDLGFMNPGPWF